jgi:hypothetical protein
MLNCSNVKLQAYLSIVLAHLHENTTVGAQVLRGWWQEVEEILETVWTCVKDTSGAEAYAKRGDRQQRNSKFNKVLARKFERLAKKNGNAIKVNPELFLRHVRIQEYMLSCTAY